MRNAFRAAFLAAALVLILAPAAASAQIQVGVDIDAIFPTDDFLDGEVGFGVAGRLGYALDFGLAELVPEVQVGYVDFGAPDLEDAVDLDLVRLVAGGRLSLGAMLRPTLFAHIGWGSLNVSEDEGFFRDRTGIGEEDALTWDVGLALDLAVLPLVDVGIHAAYNGLETEEALQWWSAGAHAAIVF